ASLPGLVLAHQERGNETGRVIVASEVKLPRLGQGMESGTIVKWLKSEGDTVEKGEPLYELDTDKVTQEVEADSGGVLLKIVVADGEVDVGTTIALIGAQGEDVSQLLAGDGNGGAPPPAAASQPAGPPAVEEAAEAPLVAEESNDVAAPETEAPQPTPASPSPSSEHE